ncbi:MAG: gamma-glutamyl-gamma-aminobutyrate hydrolase family protein, partial [Defluviitaleaceae bacterium]|nr:gamma-glutamyl-gamma-aminobutyrate hydrolase family protein [Defluviitaleaceae bacterium]
CRGMQLLNVALGGDIIQHIENHKQHEPRNIATHTVNLSGKLAELLKVEQINVNSIHHQALDSIARDLEICAVSPDGIAEAVCMPEMGFVYAVQWHPEEIFEEYPAQKRLFCEFIQACSQALKTK